MSLFGSGQEAGGGTETPSSRLPAAFKGAADGRLPRVRDGRFASTRPKRVRRPVAVVYLDNAATSNPKPKPVVAAVARVLREVNANPGRGSHRLAVAASRSVFEAREQLAALLGVQDSARLIFALNATDALNQAIHGVLTSPGEAVLSHFEHNAVLRPLRAWVRDGGGRLTIVPPGRDSLLDLASLRRVVGPATRLVVLTHASNVTGEILPIEAAGEICRRAGVPLLVDAAQTAGHFPIAWGEMPVDLAACAGHKGLLGPQGTGLLYIAPGQEPRPVRQGGTGGNSEEDDQPAWLPERYESGTLNTPGIAGLGAAARWLRERGLAAVRRHELELTAALLTGLAAIPRVTVLGGLDPERRVGVVSFQVSGWDAGVFGTELDRRFGVLVRTGLHCAPLAHRALGTLPQGAVRLSVGWATTVAEVERALDAVRWLAAREEAAVCAST